MSEFIKIGLGGEYQEINKNDIQDGDKFIGNKVRFLVNRKNKETDPDNLIEIKIEDRNPLTDKIIDRIDYPDMIKIYRNWKNEKILSENEYKDLKEKDRGEIIYHYTKNEITEENGIKRLKTDSELLQDAKERLINFKAQELNRDPVKMVDGSAKTEFENYISELDKIKNMEELKLKIK